MINVFELLINSGIKYGDRVALRDETDVFTYRELLYHSLQVAGKISDYLDNSRNNLIFIITSKSARSLIALWSVVASGNYYACIDSKTSPDRMKYLIEKMNPALIIEAVPESIEEECSHIKVLSLTDLLSGSTGIPLDELIKDACFVKGISTDPLYMVFTSGSTGYPKAIIKDHSSILAFVDSFTSEFGLSPDNKEIFGNQASFDYDVSAKDVFISVCLGAELVIIPSKYFITPARLSSFMSKTGMTTLIWAASAVKFIEKFKCFVSCIPTDIKRVFFSGEAMPVKCIDYWSDALPDAEFYNLYAPSEVTGNCLYHRYTGTETDPQLPLDKTFPDSEVIFLTEDGKEACDGQKAEAYIRGPFLARGYYMDPEQTEKRFIQNPLHDMYPDIVYKTGDYFILSCGRFLFSGRSDNQIKHLGHRIELEEIESAISKHIEGHDFCVVYDSSNDNIILLTGDDIDFKNLLIDLKSFLPKYMLPYKVVCINSIPLNDRGKVDRKVAFELYKTKVLNKG